MHIPKWIRRPACDQHGSILVQFTVYLVVLFGLAGLLWDTGRYLLAHNDLQHLADAAALAGRADLDGTSNSLDAINDAKTFLTNNVRWGGFEAAAHGGTMQ